MPRINRIFYGVIILVNLIPGATAYAVEGASPCREESLIVLIQPEKIPERESGAERLIIKSSSRKFRLVTDVLDGWGGESKTIKYEIAFSSGGQASAMGIGEDGQFRVKTGYVSAVNIQRGDVSDNGLIDIGDIIYLINYLYREGDRPVPFEAGDGNCDGSRTWEMWFSWLIIYSSTVPPRVGDFQGQSLGISSYSIPLSTFADFPRLF